MAELTNKGTQGRSAGTPSGGSRGGSSAAATRKTTAPTEQNFDPITGQRMGGDSPSGEGLVKQVKSTATDAYQTATSKASEKLEEQKSNLASGLTNVAQSVREFGSNLSGADSSDQISRITSEFSRTAAKKLESAANYFERQDLNAMYRDVEGLARRNPAAFFGGAFALGFLAARFFKSTRPRQLRAAAGQPFNPPQPNVRPNAGGASAQGL